MAIFILTYQREVVEETTIYVEADDEKLLRQNLDGIEDCLDDERWDVTDGDGPELQSVREMTKAQIARYLHGPPIHKEHHFHYEDLVLEPESEPEPVDPRQLALPLEDVWTQSRPCTSKSSA